MQIGHTLIKNRKSGKQGVFMGVCHSTDGKLMYRIQFGGRTNKITVLAEHCEVIGPLPRMGDVIRVHARMIALSTKPGIWKSLSCRLRNNDADGKDKAMLKFLKGNIAVIFKRYGVRVISEKDMISELKQAGINIAEGCLRKIIGFFRDCGSSFKPVWKPVGDRTDIEYEPPEAAEPEEPDTVELMEAA